MIGTKTSEIWGHHTGEKGIPIHREDLPACACLPRWGGRQVRTQTGQQRGALPSASGITGGLDDFGERIPACASNGRQVRPPKTPLSLP